MEIDVSRPVLESNYQIAGRIRQDLAGRGIFVINMMSSPGAGKTTLLERTVEALKGELNLAVIEGDVQTSRDAERIARHGVQAVQINTRGACHLDATMVSQALASLDLEGLDLLIVENVGNLVCPAEFELGEQARVMLLSTPEGDDKPSKYPLMFRLSNVLIVNKIDLLPHVPFSMEAFRRDAGLIQPKLIIFELSALTGQGLEPWLDWLRERVAERKAAG